MKTDEIEDIMLAGSCFLLFLVVLGLLTTMVMVDHRVRRYYMGHPDAVMGGSACVYADNPWETDDRVYCSTDPQKALDFMAKANQQMGAK